MVTPGLLRQKIPLPFPQKSPLPAQTTHEKWGTQRDSRQFPPNVKFTVIWVSTSIGSPLRMYGR